MIDCSRLRDASHVVSMLWHAHVSVSISPCSDPSLRYMLPIPRGWDFLWDPGSTVVAGQPEIIGLFAPSLERHRPRLVVSVTRVSVTRLRWDVDPVQWIAN